MEPEEEAVYEVGPGLHLVTREHGDVQLLHLDEGAGRAAFASHRQGLPGGPGRIDLRCVTPEEVEARGARGRQALLAGAGGLAARGRTAGEIVADLQAATLRQQAEAAEEGGEIADELDVLARLNPRFEWRRACGGGDRRGRRAGGTGWRAAGGFQVLHVVPWRWVLLLAGMSLVNLLWTAANALESLSRPLAAVVAACAVTALMLLLERVAPGKGRGRQ